MELTDTGHEIIFEALQDIVNKAEAGIHYEQRSVLHEIRALSLFSLKILKNESLIIRRKDG